MKDRLRKSHKEAVITLIAAGIRERDARRNAIAALDELREEAQAEWMDEVRRGLE